MKHICCLASVWLMGICFLLTACAGEETLDPTGEDALIHLSVTTSRNSINEDTRFGEDRVTEVRIMIFNTDGAAVYNAMLNFPNGFNNPSEAIKLKPDTYDFHFIANESVYTDFTSALESVTNVSQFITDNRFRQLKYNPNFRPDASTSSGRFLMSAQYKSIHVSKGGTEAAPLPLVLPTEKVELIRSLAKVEIIFRKKTSGITIPASSRISSVNLQQVAEYYSVPVLDYYYSDLITTSNTIQPSDFNYNNDSIGAVTFFIPEFLNRKGATTYTEFNINNREFPLLSDSDKSGLTLQRRSISSLSDSTVIRNYHYKINAYINATGGVYVQTNVIPWKKSTYTYMFQGSDLQIEIPQVDVSDSTVVVPTECGKIEIRSNNEYLPQGLMGAYGDVVNYWDPTIQGPTIYKGKPPYYCEKKYGRGWRLINKCELMGFLALFDRTYRIWQSNTWQGINSDLPLYPIPFRQQAQQLLHKLTGADMSRYTMSDQRGGDNFGSEKLGIIDAFFTPGDFMETLNDHPNGWPYIGKPAQGIEKWYPMEIDHQVKGYWYNGYLQYDDPANHDAILYQRFERYSFSSTVSRCVRSVQ